MKNRKQLLSETESERFTLRLPVGMRYALQARAHASKRSINAEIVTILGIALFSESYATLLPQDELVQEVFIRFGILKEMLPISSTADEAMHEMAKSTISRSKEEQL